MCAVAGGAFASTRGSVAHCSGQKVRRDAKSKGQGERKSASRRERGDAPRGGHARRVHGVWGSALWRPRARKSRDNAFDAKDARGGVPRARAPRVFSVTSTPRNCGIAKMTTMTWNDIGKSAPFPSTFHSLWAKSLDYFFFSRLDLGRYPSQSQGDGKKSDPKRTRALERRSSTRRPRVGKRDTSVSSRVCRRQALRETFRLGVRRAFPQSHPRVFKRLEPSLARCLPSRRPSARPRLSRRASGAVASRRAPPRASPSPRPRL